MSDKGRKIATLFVIKAFIADPKGDFYVRFQGIPNNALAFALPVESVALVVGRSGRLQYV